MKTLNSLALALFVCVGWGEIIPTQAVLAQLTDTAPSTLFEEEGSPINEGGSLPPSIEPNHIIPPKYACTKQAEGLMTTVDTYRGKISLIEWSSTFFGPQFSPEKRCEIVSSRFQTFWDQKVLSYISTGVLNNYNVICVSNAEGQCLPDGLLLTLEPQDNPDQVLRDLFSLKQRVTRGPAKAVVNLQRLLDEKPVLEAAPTSPIGPESNEPSNDLP
jgi:hypothetical protein